MNFVNEFYKSKYVHYCIVLLFTAICLFLSFNKHSKHGHFNYRSEIWADKGGYYVYLPALFKFNFDPDQFPDSIDVYTGNGFILDNKNKKVKTKYFYGVALMQLPFFVIADFFAERKDETPKGFSVSHHRMINVASVFYLMAGLVFIGLFLSYRFKTLIVYLTLFVLFLGSHLYYYSIDETGMSHIYSFAAFSVFIYYSKRTEYLRTSSLFGALIFGFICGLIIIIRPLNILFLSVFFILDINKLNEIPQRFQRIFLTNKLLPILSGIFVMLLPQVIYNYYSYGSIVVDNYKNESFDFSNPHLIKTWFAPMNGLFPYTPLYFILLIATLFMYVKRKWESVYLLSLFFVFSYILSCWWVWYFGCSFGARNFVEYLSVFSIPLANIINVINYKKVLYKVLFWAFILVLVIHNLVISYAYDDCFFGDVWEWKEYFKYFNV